MEASVNISSTNAVFNLFESASSESHTIDMGCELITRWIVVALGSLCAF